MRPLGDHTPAPSAAPLSVTGCRALPGEPEKGRPLPQPSRHARSSRGCCSPEMVPESGTRGPQGPWGGALWQRLPGGGLTRTLTNTWGVGRRKRKGGLSWSTKEAGAWRPTGGEGAARGRPGPEARRAGQACPRPDFHGSPGAGSSRGSLRDPRVVPTLSPAGQPPQCQELLWPRQAWPRPPGSQVGREPGGLLLCDPLKE